MTEEIKKIKATKEEWKALYDAGNRVFALKPWDIFNDTDLIALGSTYEASDYAMVLGGPGHLYGVSAYEGVEALNGYFLLRMADQMGLTSDLAMYSQTTLTCYWGDVSELSKEQKSRAVDLGYRYGDGEWLYFVSFVDGYYPVEPERAEILRFTKILDRLADACEDYVAKGMKVPFEEGFMFVYSRDDDICDAKPWPMPGYVARELIAPDGLVEEAMAKDKTDNVIEIEMQLAGAEVDDPKYTRAVNPRLVLAADAKTGEIILNEVAGPADDYAYIIANFITDYILENGRPKRIKVSHGLTESVLKNLCERCDIDLRVVSKLQKLDGYTRRMISMLQSMDEKKSLK